MFNKVVVPLDGSALAEQALPTAIRLANILKARLLLLQSLQVKEIAGQVVNTEQELEETSEAYLKQVLFSITDTSLNNHIPAERVDILVEFGVPEDNIGLVAPFEGADLIVMATHSRTGLPRLIRGSVALRVLQVATVPVVLIHPSPESENQPLSKTLSQPSPLAIPGNQFKLVVALDGSLEAEVALEPAFYLARQLGATIYLVRVLQPLVPVDYVLFRNKPTLLDDYMEDEKNKKQREEANHYLEKLQAQLLARNVNCVKAMLIGEPSREILYYAKKVKASMLVMATHARSRFGQLLLGSVAEEIVNRTNLPVLMVHTGLPNQDYLESKESDINVDQLPPTEPQEELGGFKIRRNSNVKSDTELYT